MCGICGLVSKRPLTPEHLDQVTRMNGILAHRGPDGAGDYSDTHVAMAMRRLSVIDLTGGWQPLYNEDRSLALVANGEIYNFIELRAQLEDRGHHFRTGTDCETILHLYEDFGADCVHQLRGMFVFALWDSRRKRLFLCRDRMGEKPLYLYEGNGQILFASELKALRLSGLVPFELDPMNVDLYFHYQYVPEPATPIKGVRKLPASHLLMIDTSPWRLTEKSYWNMVDAPPIEGNPGELIKAELDEVSKLVVRSDVPVGVALSGGLDSSAIAALAVRKYPGTIHAFSVGYPGRPFNDERAEAEALAKYLEIPFHEVELSIGDMVAFFPDLIYWRDDPIADISGYGYYAVMKLAKEHGVPVMLQGQGGDELFWGYPWVRQAVYESSQKMDLLKKVRGSLMGYLQPRLPNSRTFTGLGNWIKSLAGLRSGWQRLQRDTASPPERLVFYDLLRDFQNTLTRIEKIYTADFLGRLNGTGAFDLFSFPQPWPQIDILLTQLICQTFLIENGIAQGDRLSMASSVELRLPLLDYRLVELIVCLRKLKADHRKPPKAWLKASVKDVLPTWVLDRPKRGFTPPVHTWYEALLTAYGSLLDEGYLVQAGILRPEGARDLSCGPVLQDVGDQLTFKALVLEMWCRQFSAE
jgi:asparagine synthase (glutamine-hydrolysing)